MKNINISVITCMHGRPEITEVFLKGIAYLKACIPWANISVCAAVTVDDFDNVNLCQKYGVTFGQFPNSPLGSKWNHALSLCKDSNPDYVLIMGSDDLIAPELLMAYQKYLHEGVHFFGVHDLFFVNSETGDSVYFAYPPGKGRTVGAGRMISRTALELAEWQLWPGHAQSSLDLESQGRLEKKGVQMRIFYPHRGMIIDLKSKENIWPYSRFVSLDGSIHVELADATWWMPNDLLKDVVKLIGE